MKKIILSIIALYLLLMSLVYGGIFRDYTDPLKVTRYYFECLNNWEWFLTYSIAQGRDKDFPKMIKDTITYRFDKVKKTVLELKKIDRETADVLATLVYDPENIAEGIIELKKINQRWFVHQARFSRRSLN